MIKLLSNLFIICQYATRLKQVFNFYLFILYFLLIKNSFYSICLIFKLLECFLGKSDIRIFRIDTTIKIEVINRYIRGVLECMTGR
jgi:hypothetical protein